MHWEGRIYVNKVLPFKLRSAPKLYNTVADAWLWILTRSDGVDGLHYLDDFLIFGAPDSQQCRETLQRDLAESAGPVCMLGSARGLQEDRRSQHEADFLGYSDGYTNYDPEPAPIQTGVPPERDSALGEHEVFL